MSYKSFCSSIGYLLSFRDLATMYLVCLTVLAPLGFRCIVDLDGILNLQYSFSYAYCEITGPPLYYIYHEKKGGRDMAAYQPIASRLTLRLQVGSDEWGKPKLKSKSIAGVDHSADAASVLTVAQAIASLLPYNLVEAHKVDTDRVG